MPLFRKLAIIPILLGNLTPAIAQNKTVNVYAWSDYIDPKVLDDFTKETGIKVIYDTFDSIDRVETTLLAGKSGYDIVLPSAPLLQRLLTAGVFMPLDRGKLSNHGNLWPEIMERLKSYDADNKHAVPYLWGTLGLGVNITKVKTLLGNDIPQSWELLLDPKIASKLKECSIHILDSPEDVLPNVLRALKLDPNSKNPGDLQKASDALFRIRNTVAKFHSSDYINGLASGDICLALGFSGDILQARKRAKEAANTVEIDFIIPKEGALMWIDSLAIPKDAPNADNALTFINYLLRPDVAAANSNLTEYANGNSASKRQIKAEVLNNPGLYPNAEVMKRLFTTTAFDERVKQNVNRIWTRVKTGK
jgi:putrescine transport system substrate-binding protein